LERIIESLINKKQTPQKNNAESENSTVPHSKPEESLPPFQNQEQYCSVGSSTFVEEILNDPPSPKQVQTSFLNPILSKSTKEQEMQTDTLRSSLNKSSEPKCSSVSTNTSIALSTIHGNKELMSESTSKGVNITSFTEPSFVSSEQDIEEDNSLMNGLDLLKSFDMVEVKKSRNQAPSYLSSGNTCNNMSPSQKPLTRQEAEREIVLLKLELSIAEQAYVSRKMVSMTLSTGLR